MPSIHEVPDATETWLVIPNFDGHDFDGRYSVSNIGRVRSHGFPVLCRNGVTMRKPARILKDFTLKCTGRDYRYRRINLYNIDGKLVQRGIHQLVMLAFVGPSPDGLVINHKDGDPRNNRLGNLEYVTPKENSIHASDCGLLVGHSGESNGMAKLTVTQVGEIKYLIEQGYSNTQIANCYFIHHVNISHIRTGRSWADVPIGNSAPFLIDNVRPRGGPTRNYKGRGRLIEPDI